MQVVGDATRPRGRAVNKLTDQLPGNLHGSLCLLLRLFEAACFSGYSLPNWQGTPGGGGRGRDEPPSERAERARRQLWIIQQRLGLLSWSAVWHLIFWGQTAEQWAHQVRSQGFMIDRGAARPILLAALAAIASMRPPRRARPGSS